MAGQNPKITDQEKLIQGRVGGHLKELRLAAGMTSIELADRAGISQGQLSKIETGKATLSIRTLTRLCQVLDRPVGYLFQSRDEQPRVLGTLITVEGPEHYGIQWFAREVQRLTESRLTLIPLRPSQLGTAAAQVDQLRDGIIDLFIDEPFYYGNFVPQFSLFSLPYLFQDDDHLETFLNGDFFRSCMQDPLRQAGVRLINQKWNWRRGVEWVLTSARPIVSPEDLQGLRVRTYDSTLMCRFWHAMGAKPVVVPWVDVPRALNSGAVDVVPTHKAHLYPLKFCRYAGYVTRLGDLSPVLTVAMNEAKYQILPPDIQDALGQACDRAGVVFSRHVLEAERKNQPLNIRRFKAAYLTVDIDQWRRAAKRVRDELAAEGLIDSDFAAALATALNGRKDAAESG